MRIVVYKGPSAYVPHADRYTPLSAIFSVSGFLQDSTLLETKYSLALPSSFRTANIFDSFTRAAKLRSFSICTLL